MSINMTELQSIAFRNLQGAILDAISDMQPKEGVTDAEMLDTALANLTGLYDKYIECIEPDDID